MASSCTGLASSFLFTSKLFQKQRPKTLQSITRKCYSHRAVWDPRRVLIAKIGRYKPNQLSGFALMSIGIGRLILWDQDSPPSVKWIVFQIVLAAGI